MPELEKAMRQSHNHQWDRINAKEGDDLTVTVNPRERALLFAMLSFSASFPNFLIEYDPETQGNDVRSFLSTLTGKFG